MASIFIERLQPQINALANIYKMSEEFSASLLILFETYQDTTDPSPIKFFPNAIIPSYQTPPIVQNSLRRRFREFPAKFPNATTKIIDILWHERHLEPKLFAIFLLSNIPNDPELKIEVINQWMSSKIEKPLVDAVLERISKDEQILNHLKWRELVQSWIQSENDNKVINGIRSTQMMISHPSFTNIPLIFKLLESIIQKQTIKNQNDILNLIRACISKTPGETAAFLIYLQNILQKEKINQIIRKSIDFFDPYYKNEIRKSLICQGQVKMS